MMNRFLSLISDVMLWGTLPLFGVAGSFEHQLHLPQTEHSLILGLATALAIAWAYFWFQVGERQRMIYSIVHMQMDNIEVEVMSPVQVHYLAAQQIELEQCSEDSYAAHD